MFLSVQLIVCAVSPSWTVKKKCVKSHTHVVPTHSHVLLAVLVVVHFLQLILMRKVFLVKLQAEF